MIVKTGRDGHREFSLRRSYLGVLSEPPRERSNFQYENWLKTKK